MNDAAIASQLMSTYFSILICSVDEMNLNDLISHLVRNEVTERQLDFVKASLETTLQSIATIEEKKRELFTQHQEFKSKFEDENHSLEEQIHEMEIKLKTLQDDIQSTNNENGE